MTLEGRWLDSWWEAEGTKDTEASPYAKVQVQYGPSYCGRLEWTLVRKCNILCVIQKRTFSE